MAFQVSPGVVFSEQDLTAGTQEVSVSDAAFAGPFQWGPALQAKNIGSEDELVSVFGKPDDTIASYWYSAQSFLAYSNLLRVVRSVANGALNATKDAKLITGTLSVTTTVNATLFTGAGGFVTTPMLVGQKVLIGGNLNFFVGTIVNSSAFTTTTNAAANLAANTIATYGVLVKNDEHYNAVFETGLSGYGTFVAKYPGDLGNSIKTSICPHSSAFSNTNLTGSAVFTAGSNVVTGTGGTLFSTELIVGDYLTHNGAFYQVTATVNATQLTVATASLYTATATTGNWGRKWEFYSLFDRAPGTSAYAAARGGSNDELHVVVQDSLGYFSGVPGTVLERYDFLSKGNNAKDANGENAYYKDVMNRQSAYVWWLTHVITAGGDANSAFGSSLLPTTDQFVGGQTDNANIADAHQQTGYDLFKNKDNIDISVVIAGPSSAALASYIIQNICEPRQDCVAFVSPTKAQVVNNAGSEVSGITTYRNSLPSSSYGFLDSGWKYAYNKYADKYHWVPLNGDVAGIAARADTTADPWFSPAGFTRGNVKNVVKLAWNPKPQDRDDLYKIGVNPIVTFPGSGVVLYGDKTLLNRPSAFDRINVRRLFIILEKTISRLARAQLFEFNDEFTRSQFRNIVEPYLRDVKSRRGITDYRVVCDETNNNTAVVEQNKFVGDIYVKPARSINFISLNFVAVRSGVSFQEVTGAL